MDSAVVNDGVEDFHISIMLVILLQFVPFASSQIDPGTFEVKVGATVLRLIDCHTSEMPILIVLSPQSSQN